MSELLGGCYLHTECLSIPALFDTQQIILIKITPFSSPDEFLESVKQRNHMLCGWVGGRPPAGLVLHSAERGLRTQICNLSTKWKKGNGLSARC